MKKGKLLVFYDGECGLCDQIVQTLLKVDSRQQFVFAPLQGETAKKFLAQIPDELRNIDSIILVENYQSNHPQIYVLGRAALRIAWHLGGFWSLLGWIHFLPSPLYDWAYRWVARNRKRWFPQIECRLPDPDFKDRFLP